MATVTLEERRETAASTAIHWTPLLVFTIAVWLLRPALPTWAFMWLMVLALFAGFKWLTFCDAAVGRPRAPLGRVLSFLFASPAMDAEAFLYHEHARRPSALDWLTAVTNTAVGAAILWGVLPVASNLHWLLVGWIGLTGIAFYLHFGVIHLWSLAWQQAGVDSRHIMHSPARATSVSDFWGNRWNLAFNHLVYQLVFRRVVRRWGLRLSLITVFVVSGLLHELVISLPARGGYGLPTLYFCIQALGALVERTTVGRRLGLRRGVRGWLWTMAVAAGPALLLFHPVFVQRAILPFLQAIGSLAG